MPYVENMGMVKTTVYLPESLKRGVERLAQDRGLSEAEFIRESLANAVAGSRPRPRQGFISEPLSGDAIDWNDQGHLAGLGE